MKHKIKALLATSVLAVSLILALLVYPSSGADRANFVFAASFPTETTYIANAGIYYGGTQMAFFTADGQTAYAEVGQKVDNIYTTVSLSDEYVGVDWFTDAIAYSRVYCTLSHPTAGTIFAGYITARQLTYNPYYGFITIVGFENFSEHTLIAGTYTLTTLYQIYA